ncbi:hypothetical protein ACG83_00460 [Frankia sp. R43]|nr:hypothetical protein ACG83_00460 [Frankia sp. R43]
MIAALALAVTAPAVIVPIALTRDRTESVDVVTVARELATSAAALRRNDPDLARRLSLTSFLLAENAHTRTAETTSAVLVSLSSTPVKTIKVPQPGSNPFVNSVAFSPAGALLAFTADRHAWLVKVTDPHNPMIVGDAEHPDSWLSNAVFSPDGKKLAVLRDDGTHRYLGQLWDVTDPAYPKRIGVLEPGATEAADRGYDGLHFSPDGLTIAADVREGALSLPRLWDVHDATQPKQMPDSVPLYNQLSTAFSPKEPLLALYTAQAETRFVDITDPRAPQNQAAIPGTTETMAFSPDGHTFAVGTTAGPVQIWDISKIQKPALKATLNRPGRAYGMAFSQDGHTLAVGTHDQGNPAAFVATLWDVTTPDQPSALVSYTDGSQWGDVALSADGDILATLSHYGEGAEVVLRDISPTRLAAKACEDGGNRLSEADWQSYIPQLSYRALCLDPPK